MDGEPNAFVPRFPRSNSVKETLPLRFIQTLFDQLDPDRFQPQFLKTLMKIQNVQRGAIWVRKGDRYLCTEAAGPESDKVKGLAVSVNQPSIVGSVFETGKTTIAKGGKNPRHVKEVERDFNVKSSLILGLPLKMKDGTVYGAVEIIDTSAGGDRLNLDPDYMELLEGLVTAGGIALSASLDLVDQKKQTIKLKRLLADIQLKRLLTEIQSPQFLIGQSESFLAVTRNAEVYAGKDFPVLITGESGTGKELIAREIHRLSSRKENPFLVQNCSAIPDTLLESELFGYRKGAFTGATDDKPGLFEAVRGGTIFLDEIGDMPLPLQAKILNTLQSSEIKRLGSTSMQKVDMRIISATNINLTRSIEEGKFREDLYYRLNVLPLVIPPLRSRKEDIPLLINHFLQRYALASGTQPPAIAHDAMERLMEYHWPGNIREMENLVKYLLTVTLGETIRMSDLPMLFARKTHEAPAGQPVRAFPGPERQKEAKDVASLSRYSWEELERDYILSLLEETKWNIAAAARQAGVKRSTFIARMRRRGISKKQGGVTIPRSSFA
jgi:transcriptional regulator with GAF, ATPase, and Fis domain